MKRSQRHPEVFGKDSILGLLGFAALYVIGALVVGAGASATETEGTPGVQHSWVLASFEAESEPPSAPAGVPSQVAGPERPGLAPLALSTHRLESRVGWVLESQLPGPRLFIAQTGYPELWSARGPPSIVAR
ncbi:MAG: hypothetical protein AAGK22_09650 [Acidobacteriota bacterium]